MCSRHFRIFFWPIFNILYIPWFLALVKANFKQPIMLHNKLHFVIFIYESILTTNSHIPIWIRRIFIWIFIWKRAKPFCVYIVDVILTSFNFDVIKRKKHDKFNIQRCDRSMYIKRRLISCVHKHMFCATSTSQSIAFLNCFNILEFRSHKMLLILFIYPNLVLH